MLEVRNMTHLTHIALAKGGSNGLQTAETTDSTLYSGFPKSEQGVNHGFRPKDG
jgi:hypothetical protein